MKQKLFSTRSIAEIGILVAIAYVLDAFQGGLWRGLFPNGGSIGFAMLPILILSYRRGFKAGLVGGFILSFIQMLSGVYAIASTWYNVFFQIILDYILAYPCVALAGLFFKKFKKETENKKKVNLLVAGTVLGGFMKFICHFLAGVLFWSANCPENYLGGPVVFSIVYNGEYMLPNIIINCIVLVLLFIKAPKLFDTQEEIVIEEKTLLEKPNYAKWLPLAMTGIMTFGCALVSFIISYEFYQDEYGTDISFNEDMIVVMIIGLIVALFAFVALSKRKEVVKEAYISGTLISAMACFYPMGVFFKSLFKSLSKKQEFDFSSYQNYLFIGIIALFVLVYMIVSLVQLYKNMKAKKVNQ